MQLKVFGVFDGKDKSLLTGLSLLALSFIIFSLLTPIEWITFFFSDDAYYYFLVAKHIVLGLGPTFDSYNLTNGFHPLWMLSILPIYYLSGSDPEFALRLVLILQTLIASCSLYLLWLVLKQYFGQRAAYFGIIIFFILASPIILLFNGLESALVIFLSLLLIRTDQVASLLTDGDNVKRRILLGFLLGLFALTRLDVVFFLFGLVILKVSFSHRELTFHKRILALIVDYFPSFITFLVMIVPYFIWNYSLFGHLTPISGKLKSTFPEPILEWHLGAHTYPYLASVALMIGLVLIDLLRSNSLLKNSVFPVWKSSGKHMMLGVFFIGSLLHLLWTQMFMSWGVYQWHFTSYLSIIIFILCAAFHIIIERSEIFKKIVPLILGISLLTLISYSTFLILDKGTHHKPRIEAAKWVSENLAGAQGVLISDAGAFAYFSGIPTINLDGLINGYEFQESIAQGELFDFLDRQGINYIADAFTLCHKEESTELIEAYRGKNRGAPIGYQFIRQLSDAVYMGEKVLYRPLSRRENICFVIWEIDKTEHIRLENNKKR